MLAEIAGFINVHLEAFNIYIYGTNTVTDISNILIWQACLQLLIYVTIYCCDYNHVVSKIRTYYSYSFSLFSPQSFPNIKWHFNNELLSWKPICYVLQGYHPDFNSNVETYLFL